MSRYGDYDKDYLFDEMVDFVREHGVLTLLEIVSDVVNHSYWDTVNTQVKEIEKECEGYKEKYLQMKKLLGE